MSLGVRLASDADERTGSSSRSQDLTEKVMRRDDYACRFCGFRSLKTQRIMPCKAAGDPPYATVCAFCEQCMSLERTGISGAGQLIWLPEIPQPELNHLVRAIYASADAPYPVNELSKRARDALTVRRAEAKKRLGSDDPMLLATILRENLNDNERKGAAAKLEGIRLMPGDKYLIRTAKGDVNIFPQMVKYWLSSEGPYANMPTEKWPELFRAALEAANVSEEAAESDSADENTP